MQDNLAAESKNGPLLIDIKPLRWSVSAIESHKKQKVVRVKSGSEGFLTAASNIKKFKKLAPTRSQETTQF